jgi:hypothetical protein
MQPFSPLQNLIISRLKNAKCLRYSELLPEGVANDLFNYHLQHLVKKDFLKKTDEGYSLSERGVKYVADPYPETGPITSLYKVNVITIVSRRVGKDDAVEILNQVRMSNPSYGKVGVMGGVVYKGERIEDGARRKLKQETGLDANFTVLGCERRMLYKQGELFSDVLFPIAYADTSSGELLAETSFGKNKWVPIGEAIQNESDEHDSIRAITTVLKAIQGGAVTVDEVRAQVKPFFTEEIQFGDRE